MQPSIGRNMLLFVGAIAVVVVAFLITLQVLDYWGKRTSAAAIMVRSATYGGNCGAPMGNVTKSLQDSCGGKTSCDYLVEVGKLGDPAGGCAKDFSVEYGCGANPSPRIAKLPVEASGKSVHLLCE